MKKSLDEWCLHYYGRNLFDYCMEYAKDSDAPPLDFLHKMCQLLDGYTMYQTRSNYNNDA